MHDDLLDYLDPDDETLLELLLEGDEEAILVHLMLRRAAAELEPDRRLN